MKRKLVLLLIVAALALVLLSAHKFPPGGKVRMFRYTPTPHEIMMDAESGQDIERPGSPARMPPRPGTPVPPFCSDPNGPRC